MAIDALLTDLQSFALAWPPLFFFAGVLLLLLPKGAVRSTALLVVPLAALYAFWNLADGSYLQTSFLGQEVTLTRFDGLSRPFALIFSVAAFFTLLYAWHLRDGMEQAATLIYAGSALTAVLAGDYITLFVGWEGMSLASVFLIWARRTDAAFRTGFRYLLVQIGSGLLLLGGMVLLIQEGGTLAFEEMQLASLATWAIFLAFGIKVGFPLLNNWMQDGYSAGTVTGAVTLSIFTTKTAVYALARGFPGEEPLIWIGVVMALYPALYAMIENDLRRTLAYSLNSQLGFMVAAIGVGSPLAIAGAVAYAMASVVYKGLLFMGVGAVMFRTGTAKASELGGLARMMPATMVLTLVGALSIASVPLFSGFAGKSLVLSGIGKAHLFWPYVLLYLAAVTAIAHTAIKVMASAFFGPATERPAREAPWNMLAAMALAALGSHLMGAQVEAFYELLPPFPDYEPYTPAHIVTQMQLIAFGLVAWLGLLALGLWPAMRRGTNVDFDVVYRKMLPSIVTYAIRLIAAAKSAFDAGWARLKEGIVGTVIHLAGPDGTLARSWTAGAMVLWIAVLLGATLLLNYI